MKKTMIVPTLTIGALLISSMAFAWPGGQGSKNCDGPRNGKGQGMTYEQHEERMEQRLDFMAIALDLTADQKKQLEALGEKNWQERQNQREKMQANRNELRELGQSKDFDEKTFRAKAREHADLKTDMRAGHAKMKQQFFAVLTPEQQEKAEKLWDLHGDRQHGKRGGYGDCDGQGRHGAKGKSRGQGMRYNN